MRCAFMLFLATAVMVAPSAGAQETLKEMKDRLIVEGIRVGLPDGRTTDQGRYKAGYWTPIYVDVTVGAEDIPANELMLIAETADNDGILNQYKQPVPFVLPKGQKITGLITYVRPGNFSCETTVTVALGGKAIRRERISPGAGIVQNGGVLWLSLGSKLPGLRRALRPRQNPQAGPEDDERQDYDSKDSEWRKFATIDKVEQMPRHWFGYQAVDVMVLTSSNEEFIKDLIAKSGRTKALAEWVRRGGRLIITVAKNQQLVSKLLAEMSLMDCTLTGSVRRPSMPEFALVASVRAFEPKGGVEIAKITFGAGVDLLDERLRTQPNDRGIESLPFAVQGGCGLGHIILVGCDLDAPPFTAWTHQGQFWRYLQSKIEPRLAFREGDPSFNQTAMNTGMGTNDSNELAAQLQNNLEKFGDITVISFGWVALFILVYVIIIGPLDYLFLKKVLKRLELTWITFPVVVLAVSAAAYFTAYYLKGNDLKINKLDVVDIDLTPPIDPAKPPPRIYGSTWFTLFSPRIQHYTIGLEAADGAWGGGQQNKDAPLVGWMGRPDNGWGGTGRTGAQSFFRRPYEFAPGASGLIGVPIQVWATKSFTASWAVRPQNDRAPIEASLKHPPADVRTVIGTVTNNLQADLVDVVALYKGTPYIQGRLDAGAQMHRLDFGGGSKLGGIKDWMNQPFTAVARTPGAPIDELQNWSRSSAMKGLLFNDLAEGNGASRWGNTTLRHLDQSWRLRERDEVVLVGRLEPRISEGLAEKVATDPGTPSRLWLGALPGNGQRPKLEGTMTQRTFVRVYIPVQK